MKRHIPILTFLLGAFAALGPFMALAEQSTFRVSGWGIFHPESEMIDTSDDAKDYFNPRGDQIVSLRYAPFVISVKADTPGWAVDHWLLKDSKPTGSQYDGSDVAGTEGAVSFSCSGELGAYYLAVKFRYMPLTVSFDRNGGSGAMNAISGKNVNSEFYLPKCDFQRTGYGMSQWTNDIGTVFKDDPTIAVKGHAFWNPATTNFSSVLYAAWTPNRYGISCVLDGGSWPAGYEPSATALYDQVFSLPAPTRIGYDFIGWKVTSGLDTTTAKWGTDKNPATAITADRPCFNGENEVYFKNLNPTDNAAVMLTAQWKAKTIRVTFNNEGGSSGGGILDFLDVTYGAAYPALNVPSQGGNLFRGYVIDGTGYWNEKGQPTKPMWDIPTNCTAHAQWEKVDYQLIYDENRSDGSVSKQVSRTFEYGVPTVLYDGADFSNLGCTLLGWSTLKQAEKPDTGCEIGASKTFVSPTTLYAVWEKNYFIAYDGNGATNETPMAVQKFVFGKSGQSLNPNIYGKVGYTFYGWATNRAAALLLVKSYGDREIITKDLAKTVGETNSLYAVWQTNTYYVAFDPNGGTGAAMGVKTCTYDTPVMLYGKDEVTYSNGAYDFIGWSNDVEKIIYTDLTKPVSNLCVTANGTNTLYAVWKLSELSAAMHCDNLRWESYAYEGDEETYANKWRPKTNGEGVWQTGGDLINQQWLIAQVQTNGTLSFKWKPVGCEGQRYSLSYWITQDKDNYFDGAVDLKGADDEWHDCVISNVPSQYYVHFYVGSLSDRSYCQIDRMTWTPEGSEPKYVDVDSEVTGFSMADGKLVFAFDATNDETSAYHLLGTNDLVAPMPWPRVFEIGKPSGPSSFEIPIKEDEPKMFYRIRALK